MTIKIAFLGDIVGRSGRQILIDKIPELKTKYQYDLLFVNGENSAGGRGISPQIANDLFKAGVDFITLGDHCWDEKKIIPILEQNPKIIRPANLYAKSGGKGYSIIEYQGTKIAVLNIIGRVFMPTLSDCPFRLAEALIAKEFADCPIKVIDFHAEATSEKYALFRFLAGKVSLIVGTHTHVPTADHQISKGTGYVTDLGICGSYAHVIGMDQQAAIQRFLDVPTHFEPGIGEEKISGVFATINKQTGNCLEIERITI
jgi:metallophosphoesterase (TIGR00282 family)